MPKSNPKVDGYIRKNKQWEAELKKLREIMLDASDELVEDVKWRHPCYTLDNKNIAILGAFKEYAALSFMKGALMKDPKKILETVGENTQSARVIRFADGKKIDKLKTTLKAYVKEAIAIEKAGVKVKLKDISEYEVPTELQKRFDANTEFESAFRSLTPGRQRMYLHHFGSAKQEKTREARIDKWIPQILDGKGMDD